MAKIYNQKWKLFWYFQDFKMEQININKVVTLFLLGVGSILLGFIPLLLKFWIDTSPEALMKRSWKNTLISLLLCFGGGVIMATSLVHILPEVWFTPNIFDILIKLPQPDFQFERSLKHLKRHHLTLRLHH